jgi:S-adenosylmethionine:tRNA ribosyltransferase-isomerase
MLTKDFNYLFPEELIATEPASPRDSSRLMVLNTKTKTISHKIFNELPKLLTSEYLLVFNKTRVFPARLKVEINDKEGEILLINQIEDSKWKCMVKPGKKFSVGRHITIKGKSENINAKVMQIYDDGTREISFNTDNLGDWIESNGYPPFPPSIKNSGAKMDDYQTVYAEKTGSIAAPTAGLHFTDNILKQLNENGIETCFVTLHVGRGTFLPVKSKKVVEHKMHTEWFEVDKETADILNKARKEGKKILAVGTTSVRVLESNINNGLFHHETSETDIFIYPGYKFQAIDALLTNFHLPESTLIMLISAFAGKNYIFKAYEEAIREEYRFYSFGDSMLII